MNRNIGNSLRMPIFIATLILILATATFAQRTRLKPGFNLFSPQQDVELGQKVSQDAENQLPMLRDRRVDDYLNRLGKRLSTYAPGEKYPYQFKCVNDTTINAFALPGGFLFVNRGTIEEADNEAELAGVIGHEIGHVAMRHGTNQASKAQLAQAPLAVLGGILGKDSMKSLLVQLGAGFTLNSFLLKYSRDDERQSDLIGAQILYDASYDPIYMAKFFEKLETGKRGSDFFSSHPNPDNRIKGIDAEISRLGPIAFNTTNDTSEFRSVQKYVKSLPPPPKKAAEASQSSGSRESTPPARPSVRSRSYNSGYVRLQYPDNWKVYGGNDDFTLAPDDGVLRDGDDSALAYGAIMSVFTPNSRRGSTISLQNATDQLVQDLQSSNQRMRLSRDQGRILVGGYDGLSKLFINDSPAGGREIDWLVTVLRPEGLAYFVFVAPESDFAEYQSTFQKIIQSVRF
jgi:Zn-dependent protease with chaperone function